MSGCEASAGGWRVKWGPSLGAEPVSRGLHRLQGSSCPRYIESWEVQCGSEIRHRLGLGFVVVVLCFDCPYKLNAASQVLNPKSRSFKNAPPSPASGDRFWSNSPEALISVAPGWVPSPAHWVVGGHSGEKTFQGNALPCTGSPQGT